LFTGSGGPLANKILRLLRPARLRLFVGGFRAGWR
jgi:hypothetical protein